MAYFVNDNAWAKEQEISTAERQLIARLLCAHRDRSKSVRARFTDLRLIQIFTRDDVPKITMTEINAAIEREKAFTAAPVGERAGDR